MVNLEYDRIGATFSSALTVAASAMGPGSWSSLRTGRDSMSLWMTVVSSLLSTMARLFHLIRISTGGLNIEYKTEQGSDLLLTYTTIMVMAITSMDPISTITAIQSGGAEKRSLGDLSAVEPESSMTNFTGGEVPRFDFLLVGGCDVLASCQLGKDDLCSW